MQFHQLRAFREVAAELSFTRAAKNLHYAQSTVTAQIKNLEEAVGTELFDRSRRRLALTEAGARLLPHAERIIQIAETARREVILSTPPARRPHGGHGVPTATGRPLGPVEAGRL
ncbi:LysR family transcriptional regulator [Streptomyces pilosus]|uniref:LysR family transcriptional regulator n=1 Tax=Streptomyces pilosus TaxID=28893 RepID=UPI0016760B58|nr:LysR family transcriptional regulator [Streptomyces pilosus]